jgi:hypothetical protein
MDCTETAWMGLTDMGTKRFFFYWYYAFERLSG